MSEGSDVELPAGTEPVDGIEHHRSSHTVADTASRLVAAIAAAGAKLFADIDQREEAAQAGLELRETRMVIFGNPLAGTPMMQSAPLVALELPLRALVWEDDSGSVWISHLTPAWLADRYGLSPDEALPAGAAALLAGKALGK